MANLANNDFKPELLINTKFSEVKKEAEKIPELKNILELVEGGLSKESPFEAFKIFTRVVYECSTIREEHKSNEGLKKLTFQLEMILDFYIATTKPLQNEIQLTPETKMQHFPANWAKIIHEIGSDTEMGKSLTEFFKDLTNSELPILTPPQAKS